MDDHPAPIALATEIARPARGGSTRAQCGSYELVFEAQRGGHALLWSDGHEARRFAIGLDDGATLALVLRAPRLPVRVVPRDVVVLAPGGRLRGYVQVPLVPTVVCRSPAAAQHTLLELPTRDLAAEWDEQAGTVFRIGSAWHVRFPVRSGEPRAIVPAWLANPTAEVACPAHLPMRVHDHDLVSLRGVVVVAPRRLRWDGRDFVATPPGARVEVMQ